MRRLPSTIYVLGAASLLTDLSSEMIYPLLPVFLSTVLGAGALQIGVIEGVAEATASLLKMFSGFWTDRLGRRRPFILAGYGVSGLFRPLIGVASSLPMVFALRFLDRVGKGIRSSPRDAMIADLTRPEERGRAYGVRQAMDHAGAVIGPLVASALLLLPGATLRGVFLLAAIPAVLTLGVLYFGAPEPKVHRAETVPVPHPASDWAGLGRDFKLLLVALLVFTLGNSTDAFLLVRLSEAGVPVASLALLWSLHHVVKLGATYLGGILSDRVGRRPLIVAGWLYYGAIYLAFAWIDSRAGLVAVFLLYGVYHGLVEPSEKALVTDLVPARLRGTAFGYYHFTAGVALLPASLLFGFLWKTWGAPSAFLSGAGLAIVASGLLLMTRKGHRRLA